MSSANLAITAALEGLDRAQTKLDRTAERIATLPASADGLGQDEVDLSEEAVNLILARNAYEANLATIKTADEMTTHLIDTLG